MPIKKPAKTHTSSRKKASASSTPNRGTKKASAKTAKKTRNSSSAKKELSEAEWLKLRKRTLKMFQMIYDDYQRGEFHRIF
jgi:hypothetical protein